MAFLSQAEAVAAISAKVLALNGEADETRLTFYAEKLVLDVLDYCHREDFPQALVYTCVDLALKRLAADAEGTPGPLSSVKMDDTEFKFAVASVSAAGVAADEDFYTLRPKLNLYRRVKWP